MNGKVQLLLTPFSRMAVFLLLLASCRPPAPEPARYRETVVRLQNDSCRLAVDLYGGAYTELVSLQNPVNPLSWALAPEQMPDNNKNGAPFQGHFLCLGRWGSPSVGEIAAGIPHNGQPSNTMWQLVERSRLQLIMANEAPLDGLAIRREVRLSDHQPSFLVTETVTNISSLGRASNVVQHVTLGPPFLTQAVTIQTNAGRGFNQKFAYPNPHRFEFTWPEGTMDSLGTTVDLRRTDVADNYVTTHIFPEGETYGWVTAYQPAEGLLLGYIWRLSEYPWINIWHHQENGAPVAKGLEFGTTGIGAPYEQLLSTDTRFHGQASFEYIDAGERMEKSFQGFILPVGKNLEIQPLEVDGQSISIRVESSSDSRKWTLENQL